MVKQGTSPTPLRFGALIRVSTERQEQKGESLRVQKKQIERAVESLAGKIVGWFGGQEHATPGYEKKEVDRLLSDAQRGRFDAFICSDPDRWSRDNETSERGLEILRDAGIRFFVQDVEHDLFDPNDCLFLGVSAVIGRFFAANQKKKSLDARIARAQRGCCVCGKKPWGRTWDKETETWSIDAEKQAQIEDIAKRYLAGASLPGLAQEIGMAHASIYQVLRDRCGDTWTQVFKPKNKEPVVTTIKIPPLLPEETIKAIRAKMQANRTYSHKHQKYRYLLSRMVFCQHCGSSLSGETQNAKKDRYYRHLSGPTTQKIGKSPCEHPHCFIPADELEQTVLIHLFNLLGNPAAVQRAVEAASGDMEKVKEYQERLARVVAELKKIEQGRQRILDLILKDAIGQGQAEAKLQEVKDREGRLQEERGRLDDYLANRPNPEQIKVAAKQAVASIDKGQPFTRMSWEDQRALVEMLFSGRTADGKRMGVYLSWNEDASDWTFSIIGHLFEWRDYHRLSDRKRAFMREVLDEDGPVSDRGQKQLLSNRSKSAYRCTSWSP
jgi:site-specific DNA recombinase